MKKYFESPKTVTNFEFVAGLQMFGIWIFIQNFFRQLALVQFYLIWSYRWKFKMLFLGEMD